ncbi:hypothetical protein IV203_001964 [Nitzschia inconspicua]|uniref:Uncharacterized protein n=1 Tax=Nitzschia inconspicua TaxID=303405 RepID=A0A9K3L9I3_9STRA|nr:hypothetical protein IV203_001964 [Nitzschia inconspicua]
MFQRKTGSLPTTTSSLGDGTGSHGNSGNFGLPFGQKHGPDGSGRSIKMDAPVVKSWKQSSSYTKYSYYAVAFFLLMVYGGYRSLRHWNASIWLTCHQQECTLELTPPGSRTITVTFARTQLHSAQAIKTDSSGNFLEIDNDKYEPPRKNKGKSYGVNKYNKKGPDEQGRYRTYRIKFSESSPESTERTEEDAPDGNFGPVKKYLNQEEDGTYSLHMRHFGLSQSRTRVRANVNKVDSYIKKRRQKLLLKENATLPWQGILCLVFGLMGFLLTLLIGQFYDETPKRQGGPGARRTGTGVKSVKNPTFVYDSGRPSKYPPGYQYQKKY